MLANGRRNSLPPLDIGCRGADCLFHNHVAACIRHDIEHFQDRHAATDQRCECAGETRQADLVSNRPEDRQFDSGPIPEFASLLGLDVEKPTVNRCSHSRQDIQYIILDDVADADEKLRRARKLCAEPAINFPENRNDLDQQKDGNSDRNHRDRCRVHHGGFDFFPEPGSAFEVGGQSGHHLGQQTALFTRVHHTDIELVKNFGMFGKRLRKTVAAFHARANIPDHVAHHLVGRLFRQCLQRLNHCQTGINHGRQLAGENDQVRQSDFAAAGPSFFTNLFLDGDDQQVAVQ